MEPERDNGNVEYKLKLIGSSDLRIEELATQMRYRCDQGNGEAIYNLGVMDNGATIGITEEEYDETMRTICNAAAKNRYTSTVLTKMETTPGRYVYEVLIREHNEPGHYIDVKVAVAGNVDVGKSTFLGVLTGGKYDDGRGSARLSIFNYPHEVKTGRTSSVGHHIIGYDEKGTVVNYQGGVTGKTSWPEIIKASSKVISFIDLAGHEKYLKTTILGLSSAEPDLCVILVGANKGIRNDKLAEFSSRNKSKAHINMTKEHVFLCITLGIPFAIVVTKIDMIEDQGIQNIYEETLKDIQQLIKCPGVRRQPIRVETDEDVLICARQIHTESIVPIFCVSNVTGAGVGNFKKFLNLLPKTHKRQHTDEVEYRIDSTWTVPGFGTVVGGYLLNGTINVNDKLFIGPNNNVYEQVAIRSIHVHKVSVQMACAGSYVCLGLKKFARENVRRGNVLLSNKSQQLFTDTFIADIKVMKSHSTTIRPGYCPVIYASAIKQSAVLQDIVSKTDCRDPDSTSDNILRTGDTATVSFKFLYQPEFLPPGTRFICAEGHTKLVGVVKSISV